MKKVVIITGGSSGIGKAATEAFAGAEYVVYEFSRHEVEHVSGVNHVCCDVTVESEVEHATHYVIDREGRVDVLVSNAGYGISGAIEFTQLSDAKRQFDVNLFGAFNVVKAILPFMRQQGGGRIIFVSSVAAVLSIPYQAFYSASKSAINSLCLALREEVREFGITACALMPGDVSTGFTDARNKSCEGSDVYKHLSGAVEAMEKDERSGMSTTLLAHKLLSLAKKKNPAPLYTAGWQYKIFVMLESLLPKRFSNWVVGKLYN